jgi:formylglycine-generating enzyme required for sulfatase activity
MVEVPAGLFFMGCNERVDRECYDNEKPGRRVYAGAFAIDRMEVTVEDYGACVRAGGCPEPPAVGSCNWNAPGRERHPINCVDWKEARAYCAWAGKRLPTEAEWEKAARGTDGRKYPWGNLGLERAGRVANLSGGADGYSGTAPVGSYPEGASPYGALDMVGNVWEWVENPFGEGRAGRGGSWSTGPRDVRASRRVWGVPAARGVDVGVRCAQSS